MFLRFSLIILLVLISGYSVNYLKSNEINTLKDKLNYLSSIEYIYHDLMVKVESDKSVYDLVLKGKGANKFSWQRLGGRGEHGSWDSLDTNSSYASVRALETHQSELFAGLGGQGEVWKYADGLWRKVGGGGINRSWPDNQHRVNVLKSINGYLYAGIGHPHRIGAAEVWRYDGESWQQIGKALDGAIVYSMIFYKGSLIVGLSTEDREGTAYLYQLIDEQWKEIAGSGQNGSWAKQHKLRGIYKLIEYKNKLYASTWGRAVGTGTVWQYDNSQWKKVAGSGIYNSWVDDRVNFVETLAEVDNVLVAGVQRKNSARYSSPKYSSVWAFNGEVWGPVGSKPLPKEWTKSHIFNYLLFFDNALFLGTGGKGGAALWRLNTGNWEKLGGHGVNGSWIGNSQVLNAEWIYQFVEYKGGLAIGLASDKPGFAQVWLLTPESK